MDLAKLFINRLDHRQVGSPRPGASPRRHDVVVASASLLPSYAAVDPDKGLSRQITIIDIAFFRTDVGKWGP